MKKPTQRQKEIERTKKTLDELINISNNLGHSIPSKIILHLEQKLDRLEIT
ncbi:MAG: hypothetical protein Unbinned3325contig1000_8 [Prokaryotic dsDNA virus sp.]|nr:MAG: hypothetical protein Unbinned3325contig1000_8 [Prokaryotic dsDNA virus sp.]|tara:strand:- start:5426 stop:5578 length:153 start_codon:yes stop_codon:yes gene_type:complete